MNAEEENENSQSSQRAGYPSTARGVFNVCDTQKISNSIIASSVGYHKQMNGNQTLTVTRGDKAALDTRVAQFHSQYLTAPATEEEKWALNDKGKTQLGAVLGELGYLQDYATIPTYRRLSVDFQQGRPVIDILEFQDVLANKESSFSYIRLSNLEELDAYTQARNARLKENPNDEYASVLAFFGGVAGVLAGVAGIIIASNTDWNPHGAWLLAPVLGGITLGTIIGGILESSGSSKAKETASFFQKQYQHRVVTGPEAILQALNLPYSRTLPEGQ